MEKGEVEGSGLRPGHFGDEEAGCGRHAGGRLRRRPT